MAAGVIEPRVKRPHEVFRPNLLHPGMVAVALPARRQVAELGPHDGVDRAVVMDVVQEVQEPVRRSDRRYRTRPPSAGGVRRKVERGTKYRHVLGAPLKPWGHRVRPAPCEGLG